MSRRKFHKRMFAYIPWTVKAHFVAHLLLTDSFNIACHKSPHHPVFSINWQKPGNSSLFGPRKDITIGMHMDIARNPGPCLTIIHSSSRIQEHSVLKLLYQTVVFLAKYHTPTGVMTQYMQIVLMFCLH